MIIAALVLPAAIGLAALAVEGGLWYADRHELRSMADAAAIAAAWARRDGEDEESAAADGLEDLGFDPDTDSIEVNSAPSQGNYLGDDDAIEVIIRRERPLMLSTLFLDGDTITIMNRAVARMSTRSAYCVLALDPSASGAITVQGTASVDLQGCGVNANSTAADALDMVGNAALSADWAQVSGGIETSNNADLTTDTAPEENQSTRTDPFADLPDPPSGSCDYGAMTIGGTTTLSAGRYCGNLRFNSGANVTLNAGTYIIDAGTFRVNGGATVTGTNVTIILTGSGTSYSTMTINGGATLNLTAPSTGDYAGIAIMQDRNAPSGNNNTMNGGSTMNIQGAMYFPAGDLDFTGGNAVGGGCTRIVARTVTFSGNATMGNNCSGLGLPETVDDTPVLVE